MRFLMVKASLHDARHARIVDAENVVRCKRLDAKSSRDGLENVGKLPSGNCDSSMRFTPFWMSDLTSAGFNRNDEDENRSLPWLAFKPD